METTPNNMPLEQVPTLIWMLAHMAQQGTPVSPAFLEKAMQAHPAHFVEELAARARYDAIPVAVHEAYAAQLYRLWKVVYHGVAMGLHVFIQHPERLSEDEQLALVRIRRVRKQYYEQAKRLLHERHYQGYDFPYSTHAGR